MLLLFILHGLSLFVDPVHSLGYQHAILDGFTLGELLFIHTFNGATSHDYFWILYRGV